MKQNMLASAPVAALVASLAGGSFAVAKTLLRSSDIADGTIQSRDIKKGTISLARLSKGTQALIRKAGTNGKNGANGVNGQNGGTGPAGQNGGQGPSGAGAPAAQGSGNWGIINRNTIGSPFIGLRSGPGPATGSARLGDGSLNFLVSGASAPAATDQEKAAYGNQVDFGGDALSGVNALGLRIYTTGENAAINTRNLPSLGIEVDPTGPGSAAAPNFSTLVWLPPAIPANQWSSLDPTTQGEWFYTGAAGHGLQLHAGDDVHVRCSEGGVPEREPAVGPGHQGTRQRLPGRGRRPPGQQRGLRLRGGRRLHDTRPVAPAAPKHPTARPCAGRSSFRGGQARYCAA